MIFPSTRDREVAFKLSGSLRTLLPSMPSGTSQIARRRSMCVRSAMVPRVSQGIASGGLTAAICNGS